MKKSIIYIIHASFWLTYLLLLFVIIAAITQGFTIGPKLPYIIKLFSLFVLVPSFLVFYLFYFYLFPKYIKTRKTLLSFIVGLTIIIGSALFSEFVLTLTFGTKLILSGGLSAFIGQISMMTFLGLIAGSLSIIIKGFITWYDEIKIKEELNFKNHQVELALVKSQLDPHFLFNTINNIDTLMLKNASLASEYLNKLSDILRFMLFETKTEKTDLSKEIEYLEKYIALQKIRTSNDHFVHFTVKGESKNIKISPMLFIPFVENAFKHAHNKKLDDAIRISIVIEDKKIHFECENKYTATNHIQINKSGLGNDLIKKRIELLYPRLHQLVISDQNNSYKVNLTIIHE